MRIGRMLITVVACAASCVAQLTVEQKLADFNDLVATYDKNYGPYEWKKEAFGFDLLRTGPWLERVKATRTDLEFYEIMSKYVASLNDAHDTYSLPSSFFARLGFTVDIYDGKVLVDGITRGLLPLTTYPFQIGDELVSVDGRPVEEWITEFSQFRSAANPRSTRRFAAGYITSRSQSVIPSTGLLGDSASVVIRRDGGNMESYTIPWTKTGLPLTTVGPVPTPNARLKDLSVAVPAFDSSDYMAPLRRLWNCRLTETGTVLNFGAVGPIFRLPTNFVQRLGRVSTDEFYSGIFQAGGYNIGFIRIPSFSPNNTTLAINQFIGEIVFFQQRTDGLIIDVMRNPGGSVSYDNLLLSAVHPALFRTIPFQIRATSGWVAGISSSLTSAKAQGAEPWVIALLTNIHGDLKQANSENRGMTGPLPLDDVTIDRLPLDDGRGNKLVYSKPILALTDEFSASGADVFPATLQDNQRAVIFGWRTMGAGGNVSSYGAGAYSEGSTTLTESLMVRRFPINTGGELPTAPYVENIGVRPDIQADYMTRDNLINAGKTFVDAFSAAMVDHIKKNQ